MSCDILKLRELYIPGTIIVCDGREQMQKFLKDNFEGNGNIKMINNDQHIFVLVDQSLGNLMIYF